MATTKKKPVTAKKKLVTKRSAVKRLDLTSTTINYSRKRLAFRNAEVWLLTVPGRYRDMHEVLIRDPKTGREVMAAGYYEM